MFKSYQEVFLSYYEHCSEGLFRNVLDNPLKAALLDQSALTSNSSAVSTEAPGLDARSSTKFEFFETIGSECGLSDIYNYVTQAHITPIRPGAPTVGSRQVRDDETEIVIGSFNKLLPMDIIYIIAFFAINIIAKNGVSGFLKKSVYIKSLGLRRKDRIRLDECIWRLIFYSISSLWLIRTCFMKENSQNLFNPNQVFTAYSFNVDPDEYFICLIEVSFYLHATYALFFEDVWRRDSLMVLVHHIAAIFSILSFYATRGHKIGLTAVVLRDTCDVLLEVGKLFMCLRIQHGKYIKSLESLLNVTLFIFAGAFVINQLYYYPLFCLYHGLNFVKIYKSQSRVVTGMLICALVFLILDLIWFLIILRLLYRLTFLRIRVEDLREVPDEKETVWSKNKSDKADAKLKSS